MQNIKADYFCFLLGIGLFTLPPVRLPPLVLLATPAAGLALPVFAGLCCLVAGVAVALTDSTNFRDNSRKISSLAGGPLLGRCWK